jgi:hypothetical protein
VIASVSDPSSSIQLKALLSLLKQRATDMLSRPVLTTPYPYRHIPTSPPLPSPTPPSLVFL